MLAPDGRAILLDALRPPPGYGLGRAVATTFTLDLTAALVVPLAFATSQLGDSRDPIAVMEAVRSCAERVDVFCQAGNIVVPRQASDLVAFVEPMVHQVRRPRPGHLFHPKLWFLRFEAPDQVERFRLLVLTRNLTLDRGWDLVLRLDDQTRRRNRNNDQLVALLESLPAMATAALPAQRTEAVRNLADQLRYVQWEHPDDVSEVRFWTYGIGRRTRADFSGYRHLVVSPFLTESGLDLVLADALTDNITIVSRSEELDRLPAAPVGEATVYALDPLVGYSDPAEADRIGPGTAEQPPHDDSISAESSPPGLRDLHAKLIVAERSRRAHVFVGSANVTDAAFGGNVEVLCELIGGASKLGVATILDESNGMGALLQPYRPGGVPIDPEAEQLQRRLDEALRRAAEARLTAAVSSVSEERWSILLTSDRSLSDGDDVDFTIAPLNRPAEQHLVEPAAPVDIELGPRVAADVTAFYVLTGTLRDEPIQPRSTVVRADLVDAPSDRLNAIVARQVDTPEKFLRLVLLLLGVTPDPTALAGAGNRSDAPTPWIGTHAGVLELLANALATRPQAIDDLAGLVDHLRATPAGRRVLPEGWDRLWTTVLAARRQLKPPS